MNDVTRIMGGRGQPVAVLADGENIAADHSDAILTLAQNLGDPIVRRVYGNAALLAAWEKTAGYQFIHTSSGKNFADIRMTIDAMDLAHAQDMRRYVIATSDRDFTPLVLRLREIGAVVIGFGRESCADAFREACSAFHVAAADTETATPRDPPSLVARVVAQLKKCPANEGIAITDLNALMRRESQVKIGSHPGKTWRGFLTLHPETFACDPKGPGARVRLR